MGKRSDFKRVEKDQYYTWSPKPYQTIEKFLPKGSTFAEPCCGRGDMVDHLENIGMKCNWLSDIDAKPPFMKFDALSLTDKHIRDCEYIITNPPWTRDILHQMIIHFTSLRKTWLLFDAGWACTKQAIPYLKHCKVMVPNPRFKWIEDSEHGAKDDTAWYLFDKSWMADYTKFYPRVEV